VTSRARLRECLINEFAPRQAASPQEEEEKGQ
jgi:hypothetical protein